MNKKEQLKNQVNSLKQKVKDLEAFEQKRVGKLTLKLYQNGEIADKDLVNKIAQILGDGTNKSVAKIELDAVNISEA